MAGQLKIGGNVIATHAGTEGAGTVTLDSSTLTIGSNTTVTMGAGSIGTAVTMSANQPAVKTALNASGDAPIYACRAWVSFGTASATIYGSANVSSVTRNAQGDYTINFTTNMPDENYCVHITTADGNTNNNIVLGAINGAGSAPYSLSTSSVGVFVMSEDTGATDSVVTCVAIIR